jgi:hypothetical protein
MLGDWIDDVNTDEKTIILVRAAALCWPILRCRNYIAFNKIRYSSFMHAVAT